MSTGRRPGLLLVDPATPHTWETAPLAKATTDIVSASQCTSVPGAPGLLRPRRPPLSQEAAPAPRVDALALERRHDPVDELLKNSR